MCPFSVRMLESQLRSEATKRWYCLFISQHTWHWISNWKHSALWTCRRCIWLLVVPYAQTTLRPPPQPWPHCNSHSRHCGRDEITCVPIHLPRHLGTASHSCRSLHRWCTCLGQSGNDGYKTLKSPATLSSSFQGQRQSLCSHLHLLTRCVQFHWHEHLAQAWPDHRRAAFPSARRYHTVQGTQ